MSTHDGPGAAATLAGDFRAAFCLALPFFPILTTILVLVFLAAAGGRPRFAGAFFSGLETTAIAGSEKWQSLHL